MKKKRKSYHENKYNHIFSIIIFAAKFYSVSNFLFVQVVQQENMFFFFKIRIETKVKKAVHTIKHFTAIIIPETAEYIFPTKRTTYAIPIISHPGILNFENKLVNPIPITA